MEKHKKNEDELSAPKLADWVKKTLLTGAGAVFMTEEGIRNALIDMKMPKTMISSMVAQADKTKREISTLIAAEIRHFLERMRVEDIIKKALLGQDIEIKATISFVERKGAHRKKATKKAASFLRRDLD